MIQKDFKHAKTNAAKQKILSYQLNRVETQLKSAKEPEKTSPCPEKIVTQKKKALKYEKNF